MAFGKDAIAEWDTHLYDWRGVQAAANLEIRGNKTNIEAADYTLDYTINGSARKITGVGLFTDHGLLPPTSGAITIQGDLVSDGTLGLGTNTLGSGRQPGL